MYTRPLAGFTRSRWMELSGGASRFTTRAASTARSVRTFHRPASSTRMRTPLSAHCFRTMPKSFWPAVITLSLLALPRRLTIQSAGLSAQESSVICRICSWPSSRRLLKGTLGSLVCDRCAGDSYGPNRVSVGRYLLAAQAKQR